MVTISGPGGKSRRLLERAWVPLAAAPIAVLMAFPNLGQITTHLPGDYGDAMFSLWVLRWLSNALPPGPPAVWDANIFHPVQGTLAYSETYMVPGIPFALLQALSGSAILAYNLVYLATWVLSIWFMYLLVKRFTNHSGAAFVAALAFTFSAARLGHYRHFQLTMAFFIPLVLLIFSRYLEKRRLSDGLLLGVSIGALFYSATYYAAMMGLALVLGTLGYLALTKLRPGRSLFPGLVMGGLVALLVALPGALRYLEIQREPAFQRGAETQFAARPIDFLTPTHANIAVSKMPYLSRNVPRSNIERELFVGVLAGAAGIYGGFVFLARRKFMQEQQGPEGRRTLWLFASLGLVFLVFSAGTVTWVGGREIPLPYVLVANLPGFSGIRSTARFAVFAQCILALFAGIGLAHLLRRANLRLTIAATVVLALFVLGESATRIETVPAPFDERPAEVNLLLAGLPPGPTLELPVLSSADLAWGQVEGPRQLLSSIDWNPRINGYSAFDPPGFFQIAIQLNRFPDDMAWFWIDRYEVRYLLLRSSPIVDYPPDNPAALEGAAHLDLDTIKEIIDDLAGDRVAAVHRVADDYIVELRRGPAS